ncbi:SdpI family protein [Amphibacillus sediminis]|uniref:SdpI family protein n=1 Tax=Amphibacillus sediminis TaxID=360185 RepID=UPI0008363A6A|nr:SdpI family protein [Amphibacillus sediminis]
MKKHLLPLIMFIILVGTWVFFYKQLPDQVPMQWGADGTVNWYAPRMVAMLSNLGLYLIIYGLIFNLPKVDPKKNKHKIFSKSYGTITYSILVLFFAINLLTILTSIGYDIGIHHFVPILIGVLFITVGNHMQTIRPNWFVGFRTPWTLENEEVWRKTHRIGARLLIATGFIFCFMPFFNEAMLLPIILLTILILVIIPFVYSYLLHRKLTK